MPRRWDRNVTPASTPSIRLETMEDRVVLVGFNDEKERALKSLGSGWS